MTDSIKGRILDASDGWLTEIQFTEQQSGIRVWRPTALSGYPESFYMMGARAQCRRGGWVMADLRMEYSPFMSTHEAIEWFKVQLQLLIDRLILKAKHQEGFA